MSNSREREVEARLRRRVERDLHGLCIKLTEGRGLPDRLIILPGGCCIFAEIKRPVGGRLSSAQIVQHQRLRRLGHRVEVLWSMKQVDDLIDRLTPQLTPQK